MLFLAWVDRINKVLEVLVGLALAAMTVVVAFQVFVRFVLGGLHIDFSAPWTEELARYLMVWSVFVGVALMARKADTISVEALITAVPRRIGKYMKAVAYFFVLVFYGYLFVIGLDMAKLGLSEFATVLRIPMTFVFSAMSVGAVLTIMNVLALLVDVKINKLDIVDIKDGGKSQDREEAAV